MNKLFTKIAALFLGATMAVGVGVAVGTSGKDAEQVDATSTLATSIAAGDKVIMVNTTAKRYLSAVPGPGTATTYSTSTPPETFLLDVVAGKSSGTIAFKNGSNYLNWSSGNTLTTSTTLSNNTSWNVTFSGNNATVANAKDSTRKLQYNNNKNQERFACYTSSQQPVQFYKASAATYTVTVNVNNSAYGEVSQSSVTNVAKDTSISANGSTLSVGTTNVTASAKSPSISQTYAFSNWSGIPAGGKVTENVTVTANFTAAPRTYDVTNSVSNASFTGASTVAYGTAYSGTFTANSGYYLPASLTSVTIKGTATNNYSYNSTTGEFSIAAQYVTGAIVITGACEETGGDPVGITYSLSNCTIPGKPSQMYPAQEIELTIVPDDHYKLPTEEQDKVNVTGASDWVYDDETGSIMIDGASGAVSVSVECVEKAQNTISMGTLIGVSAAGGNPTEVEEGATVTLTFTENSGYVLPTSSGVTVIGNGSSFTWTQGTGKLQITGGTGNITVSITGIARSVTSISLSSNSGSYTLGDTFTMPTVTANYNVGASEDVTASAKATGGGLENGILTSAGTKTITISYGGQSATYTATVTAVVPSDAHISKVTSTSDLTIGSTVYLVTEQTSKELSGIYDSTYGTGVAYSTNIAGAYPLTVCAGNSTGSLALANSSGKYLNWSGTKNTLNTNSTLSDNTSWTITISNGNATILNVATSTRRIVWNASSSGLRFATYNSPSVDDSGNSFHNVQIYKNYPAVVKTLKWITAEVKSGTYYQGSDVTASDFTVTAHYNGGTETDPQSEVVTENITVTNGYLANIGDNQVTLTYGGKSCNVNVVAVEQTAEYTGLSWTQGEYTIIDGQNIDFSKFGTVTAEYDDGDSHATKPISSCTVATYTKSGDVYTKVADLSDGAKITSSSHGKYLGVTYTETNTFTAYSSAPIYVVESIEDVFVQEKTYTWTKVSSIAVGDTVVLTGTKADGTAPHELSGITSDSGTIASFSTNPAGTYRLTVVAGASSGSFAFKDADDNYLYHDGTDKSLSLSDELTDASSWTVEFDSETPTKATVTNVDSEDPLQYNPGNYFRVYSSASQQPIQFYKGTAGYTPSGESFANTNAIAQKVVLEYAEHFNDVMNCVQAGTTTNVSGKWSDLSDDFDNWFNNGDKELTPGQVEHAFKLFEYAYSVEGGDTLQDMLARYDYICGKYKLPDFLNTQTDRPPVNQRAVVSPLINIMGDNGNAVAIVVIISIISVSAIGGYFFLRKRREEN